MEMGFSESQIQKEDKEKVGQFQRFLKNTTIPKTSVNGEEKQKELRIVLVGKVSEQTFTFLM